MLSVSPMTGPVVEMRLKDAEGPLAYLTGTQDHTLTDIRAKIVENIISDGEEVHNMKSHKEFTQMQKLNLTFICILLMVACGLAAEEVNHDSSADSLCYADTLDVYTPEPITPVDIFIDGIMDKNYALCDSMIAAGFNLSANADEIEEFSVIMICEALLGLDDASYWGNWTDEYYDEFVNQEEEYLLNMVMMLSHYGFKAKRKDEWIYWADRWDLKRLVSAIKKYLKE